MRIIAGTARSLPLKTTSGLETRPTADNIKETIFNILQADVPGSVFLDLFSGCGAIGLEAVSRGAKKAVLVENSRRAAACIRDNINFTKFGDRCELKTMDAAAAVRALERRYVFDIVYMDPPYGMGLELEVLSALKDSSIINEDSILVIETSRKTNVSAYEMGAFEIYRQKLYKNNQHVFLRRLPHAGSLKDES